MQIRTLSIVIALATPVLSVGCSDRVSFNDDIKPILVSNCLTCHDGSGEGSSKSGFSVKSYSSVMQGTKNGPVIVPGSSVSSTLYRLIDHKADPMIQMPPHHTVSLAEGKAEPLKQAQIEMIKQWIEQGAKNN